MRATSRRLRRRDRLRRSREFRRVSAAGVRRAGARFVVLCARPATGGVDDASRLGLTVSRKVGGAVARNRVKRRVREWFRHTRSAFGAPLEVVVIARSGAASVSYRAMVEELDRLVRVRETRCG